MQMSANIGYSSQVRVRHMARLRLALTARRKGVVNASGAKITIRNLVALGNESYSDQVRYRYVMIFSNGQYTLQMRMSSLRWSPTYFVSSYMRGVKYDNALYGQWAG